MEVKATTAEDIRALNEKIEKESAFVELIKTEIAKKIVGQDEMVESLLIGLLADGHVLLEGVPGLAKTLSITSLSKAVSATFQRIQFTPDLLPADVVGTVIYNQKKEEFSVKKGPIFANFILADEINRAPAKVQSALLEAMQERQVTIGDETFPMSLPFLVLATQNPVEQEGTYPLPEAQVDRFMLKVVLDYPNKADEKMIIRQNMNPKSGPIIQPVISPEAILQAREVVREVYLDEKIETYIVDLVDATRNPQNYGLEKHKNLISFGASPRASIALALASKAHAFLNKRGYVIPEDVRGVAYRVLRHRIGLSFEAEAEDITSEQIVRDLLNTVAIP